MKPHTLCVILTVTAQIGRGTLAAALRDGKPYDLLLTRTPFGFTAAGVTVGTPSQQQKSFVDITWAGLYQITTLCNGSIHNTADCLLREQSVFNFTQSQTYVNQTSRYGYLRWNPNQFFFNEDLRAEIGSDILRIGPRRSRIVFQNADWSFKQMYSYPFHGVFGLSPVFKGDNASTQSPFYQMWKQGLFRHPLVSFLYCYNSTFNNWAPKRAVCHGNDAIQTLGGYHIDLIEGPITWYNNIVFPLINTLDFVYSPDFPWYWSIPVTQHLIGNEQQQLNKTSGAAAVFDHAGFGRGLPMSKQSYQRLIQITNARPVILDQDQRPNNGGQAFFSVDCDRIRQFPPVKYGFGKSPRFWKVSPENYVERLQTASGPSCVLNVRVLGEGGDFVVGNFGETFLKDKMLILDFEKLRSGLVDINRSRYGP